MAHLIGTGMIDTGHHVDFQKFWLRYESSDCTHCTDMSEMDTIQSNRFIKDNDSLIPG